jgi:hypothetical protein
MKGVTIVGVEANWYVNKHAEAGLQIAVSSLKKQFLI